jgi:hypothetical protein
MTTATFKYVEDYIEFIAGYRDISGKQYGLFETVMHISGYVVNDNLEGEIDAFRRVRGNF